MNKIIFTSVLFSLSLGACANSQTEADELANESQDIAADGKADAANDGAYTFYTAARDQRRCASPMCGGFNMARLNRATTICHTGSVDTSCYTPEFDYSQSGLSELQVSQVNNAIFRGRFAAKTYPGRGNMGKFIVTEVWAAQSDATAEGVFVRIKDSNARCIAAPCANKTERKLNSNQEAQIAGIGWDEAGMSEQNFQAAIEASFRGEVIVAGSRFTVQEGGLRAKGRTATAVYRKVLPGADSACFVGGCSSQICSDQEGLISTCEFRPEYACYQTATCERQTNGSCGWTASPALEACLVSNQ
jgi:hypothetical protein